MILISERKIYVFVYFGFMPYLNYWSGMVEVLAASHGGELWTLPQSPVPEVGEE